MVGGLRLFLAIVGASLVSGVVVSSAFAWTVTVSIHGAGGVQEVNNRFGDNANQMNCTVSPSGKSEASVTVCVGGTAGGLWNSGNIMRLNPIVPTDAFNRGWRFLKWVDSSASGKVNCDPQDQTGDQTSPLYCEFQIFENLAVDLYFDDVSGPQDTSISSIGPNSPTTATTASFNFNAASDPDATFECRLDRPDETGSYTTCGGPFDKSESYSSLTDNGTYTFFVRGIDPSGNVDSTPASRTWTVDTDPPNPSITGGPAGGSVTNATSASFMVNTNEGTLACNLDGVISSCAPGFAKTYPGPLSQGSHTFTLTATDAAGNSAAVSRTWTVDSQAPVLTLTGGPPQDSVTSQTGATFTIGTNEGTVSCTLDGDPEPCTAPTEELTSLADGLHTFAISATDTAGNHSSVSRSWTVDTEAPPAPAILGGPSGFKASTSASFTFISSESGVSYACALDGSAFAPCTSPKAYSGLAPGPHTFQVVAVDAAANSSSQKTRSWTIDTKKPNTTLTKKPAARTTARTASFGFRSSESGSTFQCKLDKGAWKACKSPKTYRGLKVGRHTVQIRAKDKAGNVDPSPAKRTWTIRR